MKNLVIIALLLFVGSVFAQDVKVPAEIKAKFQALYPNVDEVKWDVEDSDFEVSFELEGDVDMSLLFNAKGNVVEVETALEEDDLPGVVEKSVENNFKGWEIKETAKIVRNGKTTFEAEFEKGDKKFDIIFSEDGTLIKKIEKNKKNIEDNLEENGEAENESGENEKAKSQTGWMKSFEVETDAFASTGANDFFILKPDYQLILQGKEDSEDIVLTITVLNKTKVVDGVETRIVEERETQNGNLVEVSRNYFTFDKENKNIYYFGEGVDIYKNGKITVHEGSWESGNNGAKFGLMVPGKPETGEKYYQEIAPEVAMDRAEIISTIATIETTAGNFTNCLKTEETTPLEPGVNEYKFYVPGIGLVKDGNLKLVKYRKIMKK